jgi:hypothetical protein
LEQGDPLSTVLFLLVAEGLSRLMSETISLSWFKGFVVGSNGTVGSDLKYVGDTFAYMGSMIRYIIYGQ